MKRKMLLFTLALPFIVLQNAVAQTASRLISEAHYSYNGAIFEPFDSTSYSYAGVRGGAASVNPLSMDAVSSSVSLPLPYNNATRYSFGGTTGDSSYTTYYYLQTFDANNNITSSITEVWDAGSSSWLLYTNTLYTYNSSNLVTSAILQVWNSGTGAWMPYEEHTYSYNAAGKIYSNQYSTWNGVTSAWDPSTVKIYYYDSSMNQVDETDQAWSGGTPVYTYQWTHTYSATNQLLTTNFNTWNGTGWVFNDLYTHAYDSVGNPLSLLYQTYNSTTSAWDNNTLYLYSNLNSANMPQTVYRQIWDTTTPGIWDNDKMYAYTYNTYNQVTNVTSSTWNPIGIYESAAADQIDDYNYETYSTSVTSVKSVVNNGGTANLYPVPAQNMLHIDLNWSEAQSATISIVDVTGNMVRQWSVPSATAYNGAVSVNDLAPGMYVVNINGQKGQIVKQIVVAH